MSLFRAVVVAGPFNLRSARASSFILSLALMVSLTLLRGIGRPDAATSGPLLKVGPELQALYDAYRAAQATGAPLVSPDPLVSVVDGLVTIDAVASGDADRLKDDLVALGLQQAAVAGRIVSGRFPVAAIAAMAALPSLRFVRAAMSMRQDGGGSNR
jgi:hypothetical protein